MPRKPSGNDVPIAFRLPKDWIDRADGLKAFLEGGRPGLDLSRSDLMRMVFAKGLEALEAESSETPPAPASKPGPRPRGKR